MRKVFLSSTSKDLFEYREAVAKAIHGLDGYHCVQMENFGARNQQALEFCRGKVRECDIFVGILGLLYGSCPEGVKLSYTEDEYVTAVEAGIPRLMFVSPDGLYVPGTLRESDEMWARQQAFRSRVNKDQIRATFSDPDELARVVVSAIYNWEKTQTSPGAAPAPTSPSDWRSRPPMDEVRIFISYAREDEARVKQLYQSLADAGFQPWLDREHIIPGMKWEPVIKKALEQSDFVLVCLSANSINKRGFLQREIKQALEQAEEKLEHDVYLIPARLDDCEVPDALSKLQWVDLFEDDGWQWLLKAIKYGLRQRGNRNAP